MSTADTTDAAATAATAATATTVTTLPDNLMIITDLGEECDDEVACLLANEVAEKGVKVTLVFTNEAAQAAFLTLKPIHSDNLKMLNISDSLADIFKDGETNTLLQIGPVHHRTSLDIGSYPYNYFLLGTLGVTLNS